MLELPESNAPLFHRIAQAVANAIRRGQLRAGDRLPSTRALAQELGVHRKTVVAAYAELRAQGLAASEPARATIVARALPVAVERAVSTPLAQRSRFPLPAQSAPFAGPLRDKGILTLFGGIPELRFAWPKELARAYGRALRRADGHRLLDYGDPRGEAHLRAALADLMRRTRGVPALADNIVVVRGALHGLYLTARALLRPGDCVAVEALSHPSAIGVLRLVGARVEPIPVDAGGLDVAKLAELCTRTRVRAVYLTPCHQLPTTVTLAAPRRKKLLELARQHELVLFEDDYDHECHYDGRPALPLAAADRWGVVVYLGTFSKVLAPGLRLGFIVATPDVARQLADYRAFVDQQGDHVQERAIADLLEDGDLERFVRHARRVYLVRRDALCAELRAAMPSLEFVPPRGGMAVWLRAPGVDTDAWAARAYAAGVAFQPGSIFGVDAAPTDCARVGFAACTPRELAEAVRRMARTRSP
jgi:GntR family transcriptional regulator/MocR family aminotransferase